MKTCLVFPHLSIQMTYKRVRPIEKLPYPGDPNCNCNNCQETWMNDLVEAVKKGGLG